MSFQKIIIIFILIIVVFGFFNQTVFAGHEKDALGSRKCHVVKENCKKDNIDKPFCNPKTGQCEQLNPTASGAIPTQIFSPPTNTIRFSDAVCTATNFFTGTVLPPIAVLMGLVAGFLFLISGGSPQKVVVARNALLFTLVGTALLLLAPGIVALIANIFGGFQIASPSCGGTVVTSTITDALLNLVNWFSWFIAVFSVVMGLYAGFLYMTSAGDVAQTVKARKMLSYTIIGIAVAIASFSIIALVGSILGL